MPVITMNLSLDQSKNPHKTVLQRALFFAVMTIAVLIIFQPFGTYSSDISYKYLKLSGYGLATFCSFVLAGLVEIALLGKTHFLKSQKWLMPLGYLLAAAIFNHGYFAITVLHKWHWQNQLLFFGYVSAIGLFPVLFLFVTHHHGKQFQSASVEKQDNGGDIVLPDSPTAKIQLLGDNKNEQLSIAIEQLMAIKAADNYCEITHQSEQGIIKTLLRISLNNLIAQLPETCTVHRCHRSYAVNLEHVVHYSGNSAGLNLILNDGSGIPVSRGYAKHLKTLLSVTP